jgi:hypothetical protein
MICTERRSRERNGNSTFRNKNRSRAEVSFLLEKYLVGVLNN